MNSYTITQPNAISATFTPFPPSICSGTNGAITTTVTGGTPSYTYNWNPTSATTASIGGLTAGSYSLTVNDAAGCTTTLVASLSDPTGPALTVTSTSVSCNSLCNGSATVSAVGTGPMTYTWSTGGSSTFTVGSLCQGTFAVNVTDQSVLCTTSQTFNITQPPSFTMNPIPLNPTCGGTLCNGSINSTPAGGTGPYTFTLSFATGSLTSNPPYTGLCGGAYTLGVTDNNSCNYAQSFTLTQPPAVTLTVNQTDVLCFGQCNGSITAVASGGTAGYTYTWTGTAPFPPTPLPNIVNLCPDTYTLSVLDGNNCPSSTTVQIIEPPLLTTTLTSQNAICSGSCNGSATITPSGGTPNYSYSWTGSISSVSLATGLCAGNYTATVTDANGCTSAQGYTITQPAPVNVTLTPTNPLCNTGCNGIITTSVTGGNGAYTYSLIPTGISTPTATGLCAASYTMLVFDGNSCPGQAITTLVSPPALLANVSTTNAACGAVCNGIASSNPINGTPSYTYTWTNSTSTFTGQTITNLCADNYTVMITDANSCTATQQFTLSTPPPLTITPSSAPATCSLVPCDGSITLVASGGTPGYSYSWTPAVSTGSVANNVCAGVYTVVVTDLNTCSNTFQVPLSNSNGPTGAAVTSSNVICNGQCNGVASVDAPITGGTSPYTVTWISTGTWTPATSPTTMPQSNLCANTYTAQIVDANTCQFYVPVTITEPAPFLDNSSLGAPICNGICNGAIAVTPSGGTPSYTFSWSTGAVVTGTTTSLNGLCTGAYSLTVQDANLCTYTVGYVMPSLTSITANTTSINNTCFGDCNGVINVVNLVGGTPGYTFNWSDPLGQSTQQATGLCNGNYFVVVTDAVGCFDTIRGLISSAPAITMTSSVTEPACGLCNGTATVGASGGTAPYTYAWSTSTSGPTASNLCAGLYVLTITDSQGCFENINLPVSNSTGITGEIISTTDETCPDLCDGSATVTAVGGTAPITYFWPSTAVSTNTINNLCGGNSYFVQMQDAVGCIRTTSVTINSNSDFTVTPFISQPSCTVNNGSIIVNVTGSPGPFSYAWNPVALNSPTLNNIPSGTYTLVVTNTVTGCSKTSVYNVTSVNAPVVSVLSNDASCNGSCNGSASFIVNSGSAGFTYTWSTGSTGNIASIGGSSSITNLCGGVVTFTLDGADGCRLTQNLTINQPNSVALSLPVINTPDCNNDCNGSINLVPSGGSLPYTYSWSPGASTLNPASGLCAGPGSNTIYSVTVTDANGCTDTMSINLINPAPLVLTTSITPSSCNNTSDAVITSTVTGGLPVYTYTWTGPAAFTSTNSSVSGLAPGVYSLQLADFSGCQQSTTLQVVSNVTVIAVAGNDSTFCQNGAFSLDGSASVSSPTATYGWYQLPSASPFSNAITVPVTPPIGTTTFVLMVQENGCTDSDTLSLTSNVPPVVDAGPNFTLTIYTSTVIGGSPTSATGVSYTWSPAFSLDNANIPNPTASNTVNTAYTVTVTDANGCTASDTMHVHIFPDIIIPNGFSPNGDGKNDTWIIDNIEQFPDCVVEVYNRWGELLFMSKGYVNKWDGKYNGKDLPVGTYYYIINLNHEFFPNPYTGPITIFR
jgi:gliding motility-associated-like protein